MLPFFTVLGKNVSTYAASAIVGIFAACLLMLFISKRKKAKIDLDDTVLLSLFVLAGVFIGGHLLYGITNLKYFHLFLSVSDVRGFLSVATLVFGGSVFYGGLIGGTLCGIMGIKILRLDMALYGDLMAVCAPLFHGFARIGCFLAGCCYGIESKFGFAAHGNEIVPDVNGVVRFPVQLLESVGNFLIFSIMLTLFWKGILRGKLFFIYLMSYSVLRFLDEFLRGDVIRGFVGVLSTSQFISIFVFIFSFAALTVFRIFSKKVRSPQNRTKIRLKSNFFRKSS